MTTTSKPRAARRARKRKPAPTPVPVLALAPTPAPVPAPTRTQGRTQLTKPTADIIPFDSYIKDARNRMRIHDYEIQELRKDAVNVYEYMIGLYKRVTT
tara:strand:+ start:1234 stop:1530 length:297 start_codon:yes stop_codon:yes gene_type:complete